MSAARYPQADDAAAAKLGTPPPQSTLDYQTWLLRQRFPVVLVIAEAEGHRVLWCTKDLETIGVPVVVTEHGHVMDAATAPEVLQPVFETLIRLVFPWPHIYRGSQS